MKKTFYIIILLAAIELGVTYYVGSVVDREFHHYVALLNETPGVKAELTYNRGFLSSKVALTVSLIGEEQYALEGTLLHGPIVIDLKAASSKVKFCTGFMQATVSPSPVNIPITVELRLPYEGGVLLSSQGGAFQYSIQEDFIAEGTGWESFGEINHNHGLEGFSFENKIPALTISNKKEQKAMTVIKGIKVSSKYDRTPEARNIQVNYEIADIENTLPQAALTAVKIQGTVDLKPEAFDAYFKLNFEKATFDSKTIGPMVVDVNVKNLDKAILQLAEQKPNKALTPIEIEEIWKKVIIRGVNLNLDKIQIVLPQGEILVKSHLSLGGADLKEPITPQTVGAQASGDLYLSLPSDLYKTLLTNYVQNKLSQDPNYQTLPENDKAARLIQEVEEYMGTLKQSEILTETDQKDIIEFSFSKGQWSVKGKNIQPPNL